MIVFPYEFNRRKTAIFKAVGKTSGGMKGFPIVPLSFRDWPETAARVDFALKRAKRRPRSRFWNWLKKQLLRGQYNWSRNYFTKNSDHIALAWNGLGGTRMAFLQGAEDAGAAKLHAELAPFPKKFTLDPVGVNAENSVPRSQKFYLDWAQSDVSRTGNDWRGIGDNLIARPSRRTDVGQSTEPLAQTPFIFCPLQVPTDSQVTLFAGSYGGIEGFIAALTEAVQYLPEGWHLRLKEHPSARVSLHAKLEKILATGRVVLDNERDSFAQLAASRGVVTLNSSMGLQAFFFDKPVIVAGQAFFAQPGLVECCPDGPSLREAFDMVETLSFDAAFRSIFMNWLCREYYPGLDLTHHEPIYSEAEISRKLLQAREISGRKIT